MNKQLLRLLACACLLLMAASHPMSVSRMRLNLHDANLDFTWRMQVQTLREVEQLGLDQNQDEQVSNEEIRSQWSALKNYLEEGVNIQSNANDGSFEIAGWQRLNEDIDWLSVHGSVEFSEQPNALTISSNVFYDHGNPDHRLDIELSGLRTTPMSVLLSSKRRSWDFTAPAAFTDYLKFGFTHVLEGYGHLAFLLALLFGIASAGAMLWAVSAFTLAHSITLACSALGFFALAPSIVEPGIAISICLTLWWHRRSTKVHAWRLAMMFGLVHGFGFAGVLGEIGLPSSAKTTALLSFNIGVELGQLLFIVPIALVVLLIKRKTSTTQFSEFSRVTAICLGAFSLKVFCDQVAGTNFFPLAAAFNALIPCLLGLAIARKQWREIFYSYGLFIIYLAGQAIPSMLSS